jgi:hypothetical protein
LAIFFVLEDSMKKIPLTQGKFAKVDDENYADLIRFKWFAYRDKNTFYAARWIRIDGKRYAEKMHRRSLLIVTKIPFMLLVGYELMENDMRKRCIVEY